MDLSFLSRFKPIHSYWNLEVIHFTGQQHVFGGLPDVSELVEGLLGGFVRSQWEPGADVGINASIIRGDGQHHQLLSLDVGAARRHYNEGYSLCFGDLSNWFQGVGELKQAAVDMFGHPETIVVTAYLSPPGAVGVLHYDRQHNFFFQREGEKSWSISERPATKNPFENLVYPSLDRQFYDEMNRRGYNISLPRECGRDQFTLTPGGGLYVPPGFYHSPETLGAPSLHYTLTIEPVCFYKDFNKRMFDTLIANCDVLNKDYRFMSAPERKLHFEMCSNLVSQLLQRLRS